MRQGEHVTELLCNRPLRQTTRAKLEFCTRHFGAALLSYLFLLLQIVQGHGGKDGLDFDLEPTDGEGDTF